MTKTLDQHFSDWETEAFGFGYGTGEEHTLPALKTFFGCIGTHPDRPRGYDYRDLEAALGGPTAWLLINALCKEDIIEYGTSPRGGWLTPEGEALKAFVDSKSAAELVELCTTRGPDHHSCMSDACNCDPNKSTIMGRVCPNPFWPNRVPPMPAEH